MLPVVSTESLGEDDLPTPRNAGRPRSVYIVRKQRQKKEKGKIPDGDPTKGPHRT